MKSRLQELADVIRAGTEDLNKLKKDQKAVQDRISKIANEITALRTQEKELWFELECCNADVLSKEQQLASAKKRVSDIVQPSWGDTNAAMPF